MNRLAIPADKANHIIYGALAALLAVWLAALLWPAASPRWVAVGSALLVGLAKEAADYISNRKALQAGLEPQHTVDPRDVLATVMGGVLIACAP